MSISLWAPSEIPYMLEEGQASLPQCIPYLCQSTTAGPTSAIIVLPGGGYGHLADHEGEPIAKWLNRIGISAFVLKYRISPYQHPVPLTDVQRTIRYIRAHADEYGVDPQRIGVLGFSAGGHLASTAGTHYDLGNDQAVDPIERLSSRPDLMVLCYPVISFAEYGHLGSARNLLGQDPPEKLLRLLSNELQVTTDTPPAFIWHTSDDAAVPVENSLLFASALSKQGVPFELHSYESGRHGLGLAEDHPEAHTWSRLCELWLRKQGF